MRSRVYDVERSSYLGTNLVNDRYCKSVNRNTIFYATSVAIVTFDRNIRIAVRLLLRLQHSCI